MAAVAFVLILFLALISCGGVGRMGSPKQVTTLTVAVTGRWSHVERWRAALSNVTASKRREVLYVYHVTVCVCVCVSVCWPMLQRFLRAYDRPVTGLNFCTHFFVYFQHQVAQEKVIRSHFSSLQNRAHAPRYAVCVCVCVLTYLMGPVTAHINPRHSRTRALVSLLFGDGFSATRAQLLTAPSGDGVD